MGLAGRLYKSGTLVVHEIDEINGTHGSIKNNGCLLATEINEVDSIDVPMRISKDGVVYAKEFSEFLDQE